MLDEYQLCNEKCLSKAWRWTKDKKRNIKVKHKGEPV